MKAIFKRFYEKNLNFCYRWEELSHANKAGNILKFPGWTLCALMR